MGRRLAQLNAFKRLDLAKVTLSIPSPMTAREWRLGKAAVTLAPGLHAGLPRYEWRGTYPGLIRIDRWTGRAEMGRWNGGRWVALGPSSALPTSLVGLLQTWTTSNTMLLRRLLTEPVGASGGGSSPAPQRIQSFEPESEPADSLEADLEAVREQVVGGSGRSRGRLGPTDEAAPGPNQAPTVASAPQSK